MKQHREVSKSKAFRIDNNSANVVQVDSAQVDTEMGKIRLHPVIRVPIQWHQIDDSLKPPYRFDQSSSTCNHHLPGHLNKATRLQRSFSLYKPTCSITKDSPFGRSATSSHLSIFVMLEQYTVGLGGHLILARTRDFRIPTL